jgi:hypothetical protein
MMFITVVPEASTCRAYRRTVRVGSPGSRRGVPFVAIYDSLRGHIMGGQWARSKRLFPYAHG